MKLESYQIPKSFQSYLEQFEADPDTAISRLENHVQKRKTGAIGYFFLSWLYNKNDQKDKAVDTAIQAKILAPGSRFFEQLPYFLSHPHSFEAWSPKVEQYSLISINENISTEYAHPISDLDSLISKLSSVERKRIKPSLTDEEQPDLGEKSADVDDIVTETLAVIHEKQKNYKAAIETYRKLKQNRSYKADHYDEQIRRLEKKMNNENED